MRSIVRVKRSSHVRALSEDMSREGLMRKWRNRRDEAGLGGDVEDEDRDIGEEREGSGLGMDGLRGVDGSGEGSMQFHHVTRRQFEVRMVGIRENGFEAEEVDWGEG